MLRLPPLPPTRCLPDKDRPFVCLPLQDVSYFHMAGDEDGNGRIPYDPSHNNTAIVAGGRLFTATTIGWQGSLDALIYGNQMTTVRKHSEVLNAPSFVGAVDYADKVFFFFSEVAVEHINCGKVGWLIGWWSGCLVGRSICRKEG